MVLCLVVHYPCLDVDAMFTMCVQAEDDDEEGDAEEDSDEV